MSFTSKISFILFFLFGLLFFAGFLLVATGSTLPSVVFMKETLDLPFFSMAVIFLFSRINDALVKHGKKSWFFHFLLAFFATILILALIYLNAKV